MTRAYSHYLHRRSRGGEDLSFAEAVLAEPHRLAAGDERARAHYSYVDRGRYLGQLRQVFSRFPKEAVHIQLFEDLRDQPQGVFTEIVRFLGADPQVVPEEVGRPANAYQQFRSVRARRLTQVLPDPFARLVGRLNRVQVEYPPMPEEVRRRLVAEYAAERGPLEELLGRRLDAWQH